jgi:hypothetical protein
MAATSWIREMPNVHAKLGALGVVKSLNAVSIVLWCTIMTLYHFILCECGGGFFFVKDCILNSIIVYLSACILLAYHWSLYSYLLFTICNGVSISKKAINNPLLGKAINSPILGS